MGRAADPVIHSPQPTGRRADRPEPHEPGLVVGHVLHAGPQHLAAVALGGEAVAQRRPRAIVLGDGSNGFGG